MTRNRIKALREKRGLSQKELAALVGTSQQQIQRIENDKQSIRFDLALEVCRALEASMQKVFPEAAKTLSRSQGKERPLNTLIQDPRFTDEMDKAGIDMDPDFWFFKYRLRGGAEGVRPVSSNEKQRLWHAVQGSGSEPFVVFDSEKTRIILNLNHLIFCQFLFESWVRIASRIPDAEVTKEDDDMGWGPVSVYLADSPEPLNFDVDPDGPIPTDLAEDEGQFRSLVFAADSLSEDDSDEVLYFTDGDGETAFFRAWDVAMIEIPLPVLKPDLLDDTEEETANIG